MKRGIWYKKALTHGGEFGKGITWNGPVAEEKTVIL
jgi:hypothetical protein